MSALCILLSTYFLSALGSPLPALFLLLACSLPALHNHSPCSMPALCLLSAFSLPSLCLLSACSQPTRYLLSACSLPSLCLLITFLSACHLLATISLSLCVSIDTARNLRVIFYVLLPPLNYLSSLLPVSSP
jgi:hypothetical protein